jgi:hypothetical protein
MSRTDWNDELDILSAENVSFAVETAGLGSRFGAALIDMTIQGFVIMLLLLVANWMSGYVLPLIKEWSAWAQALGGAFLILLGVTITHGYYFCSSGCGMDKRPASDGWAARGANVGHADYRVGIADAQPSAHRRFSARFVWRGSARCAD